MSLYYVMTMIPRRKGAEIYKLKSNPINLQNFYSSYDEMKNDCLDWVEATALNLCFHLRYGDLVIDQTIAGTLTKKKITRKGIFIFNGKHLQYLDRTLNGTGCLPHNYPSFTIFPIGYWKNIFADNIIWITPPKSYKIINNNSIKVITPLYTITTSTDGINVLTTLITGSENIIMYKSKSEDTNIYFDINIYNIYIHRKNEILTK